MSKKKKKHNKRPFDPKAKDLHHILWTAAKWNIGYAKRLRLHPWLIMPVSRDTLHREIHSKIAEIPLPNERFCKKAYLKLLEDYRTGKVLDSDTLEDRIDWLLDVFEFEENPYTTGALWYQKEIVRSFYKKPPNY